VEKLIIGEVIDYNEEKQNFTIKVGGRMYFSGRLDKSMKQRKEDIAMIEIVREDVNYGKCRIQYFGSMHRNGEVLCNKGKRSVIINPKNGKLRPVIGFDKSEGCSIQAEFRHDEHLSITWNNDRAILNDKGQKMYYCSRIPGLDEFLTAVDQGTSDIREYVSSEYFEEMVDLDKFQRNGMINRFPELEKLFGSKIYDMNVKVVNKNWREIDFIEWLESVNMPEQITISGSLTQTYTTYYMGKNVINKRDKVNSMYYHLVNNNIDIKNEYIIADEVTENYSDNTKSSRIFIISLPDRYKQILKEYENILPEAN
jgi:hypothetical protein